MPTTQSNFRNLLTALLIVAVAAAVYLFLNPEQRTNIPFLEDVMPKGPDSTTVYKWQDDKGKWHYTTEPPPEEVSREEVEYRHDANVVPPPPGFGKQD